VSPSNTARHIPEHFIKTISKSLTSPPIPEGAADLETAPVGRSVLDPMLSVDPSKVQRQVSKWSSRSARLLTDSRSAEAVVGESTRQ